MDKQKIYTVGYTLFCNRDGIDLGKMFEVLQKYGVSYLTDIRSVPFSKQYPQCKRAWGDHSDFCADGGPG